MTAMLRTFKSDQRKILAQEGRMNEKRTGSGGDIKSSKDGQAGKSTEVALRAKPLPAAHFTPRHVRIPHMREKVDLLYKHHPTIKKQYELAKAMEVSEAALAGYINGIPSADGVRVNPGTVPNERFSTLVAIFEIPGALLESENFAEFKSTFSLMEAGRGAWDRLVRPLSDDEAIEIKVNKVRRIIDPDQDDDHGGIFEVYANEEIMLRVANQGFGHGVLLQRDRDGWHPLWPNAKSRETEIGDALVFPRQSPGGLPRFAELEGSGVHLVLAIFTQEQLPSTVINAFMAATINEDDLNKAASTVNNRILNSKGKLLSRRFLLVSVPRPKSQPGSDSKPD
jgi:hypothetical protein